MLRLCRPLEAECRRKWKILRDQHRRERRRESGGLLEPRQWRYSAVLSFLNPLVDASTAPTNSWAPQPQSSRPHDMAGCSTTSEGRSYDNYGESGVGGGARGRDLRQQWPITT